MINIKNKITFESNCWVGEVDASNWNSSEEERIKAVTDIASITKGRLEFPIKYGEIKGIKDCNHWSSIEATNDARKRLYNKLLTESAGKPSIPFEFIPIIVNGKGSEIVREEPDFLKYGTYSEEQTFTNLRNVLNYGYRDNYTNTDEDYSNTELDFKVIVGRVPMKVISHLRTHRAFSWLVESSRNKRYLNEVEFWYPSWWQSHVSHNSEMADKAIVGRLSLSIEFGNIKPEEATMELSDRRLVHFAMAAWKQDTNAWDNLFAVRGNETGTMSITGMTVDNIKILVRSN